MQRKIIEQNFYKCGKNQPGPVAKTATPRQNTTQLDTGFPDTGW